MSEILAIGGVAEETSVSKSLDLNEHSGEEKNGNFTEVGIVMSRSVDVVMITDEHVYANVKEMEEESRKNEQPPFPVITQRPVRDLGNGWLEFITDTGRSYFFNPETSECHWKPPRFLKPPTEVLAVMNGSDGSIGSITEDHKSASQEGDSAASCSVSGSPLAMTKSLTDMLESMDSGISRTSLNLRNRVIDKRLSVQAVSKELAKRVEAFKSTEELAAKEITTLASSLSKFGHLYGSTSNADRLSSNLSQKSIKTGTLQKCKIAESGVRIKKKEWSTCFLFLSSAHIIFYKDEKSAEKSGRHYEAPLGMCDLRGASIQWVNNEKDKRKKHIFQLELIDGTLYYFATDNSQDINTWYHALRQVIAKLPRPDSFPTPVIEHGSTGIVRTASNVSCHHSNFGNSQIRRSVKKLPKGTTKDLMVSSLIDEKTKIVGIEELRPSRESIIEKLRRFFRSRPTIESLKEKGIYKPEPVFGSTLAAICQHEQNNVPRFIQLVTEVVESRGIDTDGLYRVSGNLSAIQRIRCQVDQEKYSALLSEDDVHVLTGALKLFFRELSEPIFPVSLAKDFINANRLSNGENKLKTFEELLKKLPVVNRETLKVLFSHLIKVASHADKNRMEIHNLAIMFGPSLFNSGNDTNCIDNKKIVSGKKKASDKKVKEKPVGVQSNSHLAFNMIMQGQTVEYLLKEFRKFPAFQSPVMSVPV